MVPMSSRRHFIIRSLFIASCPFRATSTNRSPDRFVPLTGYLVQFLIDNAFLILVAFISGGMLVWPLIRARADGPALSTLQATQLINRKHAQVVDTRESEEFVKGSLPNAKNIPLASVAQRASELKKDKPVLIVCNVGKTAGQAAAALRTAGFAEVYTLAGGLAAWRSAGLPLGR